MPRAFLRCRRLGRIGIHHRRHVNSWCSGREELVLPLGNTNTLPGRSISRPSRRAAWVFAAAIVASLAPATVQADHGAPAPGRTKTEATADAARTGDATTATIAESAPSTASTTTSTTSWQ